MGGAFMQERPGRTFPTKMRVGAVYFLTILFCFMGEYAQAKRNTPEGLLAVSTENSVILSGMPNGELTTIDTGPVGFLFPAPGGILFAPDLVHGRTTIIDTRNLRTREVISRLIMPRFTVWKDRYLVLAEDLMVLSYPEHALVLKMDAEIMSPWQLSSTEDGMSLLVLERAVDGRGPSVISAYDLGFRQQVFRKSFESDYIAFALMTEAGMLVVADRSGKQLLFMNPVSLGVLHRIPLKNPPADIVGSTSFLFAGGEDGVISRWRIKGMKGEKPDIRVLNDILVHGSVSQLSISPDGLFLAAATTEGELEVFEIEKGRKIVSKEIPSDVRDLVWIDPLQEGPLLPLWSDRGKKMPETLRKKSNTSP